MKKRDIYNAIQAYIPSATQEQADEVVRVVRALHVAEVHRLRSENGALASQKYDLLRRVDELRRERDMALALAGPPGVEIASSYEAMRQAANMSSQEFAMLRYERDAAKDEVADLKRTLERYRERLKALEA